MTATQAQLDKLRGFVEDAPPAEKWKLTGGGGTAQRWIKISDEINWMFHLFPLTAGGWRAYCFSPGSERKFTANLDDCKTWLNNQAQLAHRLRAALDEVEQHAHLPGWQLKQPRDGVPYPYAQRPFEFPEVKDLDRVYLVMSVNGDVPSRWAPLSGSVSIAFSAGPEESITGGDDEVSDWLKGWEKCLSLPAELAGCKSVGAARELLATAGMKHLGNLAYLFEIPATSSDGIRQRLIQLFVPAKVRNAE